MTTYCAVVKYEVNATDREKIRALHEGLQACATELVDLGYTGEQIEAALEEAGWAAEEEARGLGRV